MTTHPTTRRHWLPRLGAALAGGAGLVALAAGPSAAQVCYPIGSPACTTTIPGPVGGITVSDVTVTGGQSLLVTGDGFQAGSTATVTIESVEQTIGTAVVDAQGKVSTKVTIPTNLENGVHTIRIKGTGSNGQPRVLSQLVTLTGAGTGTGTTGTGLARTGVYVVPASVAGLGLLGTGVFLARTAKKKKALAN